MASASCATSHASRRCLPGTVPVASLAVLPRVSNANCSSALRGNSQVADAGTSVTSVCVPSCRCIAAACLAAAAGDRPLRGFSVAPA